jgi:hypothetical protein
MISAVASNSTTSAGSTQGQDARLEALFKKIDTNGDGTISQQEFESAFVSISQKGGQAADAATTAELKAKADAIYQKMDTQGNGQVTQAEFDTAAKAHEAQQTQHAHGHGGHHHGGGGEGGGATASSSQLKVYDPADTNKDGVVSPQEEAAYQALQAAKATALNSNASNAVQTYSSVEAGS